MVRVAIVLVVLIAVILGAFLDRPLSDTSSREATDSRSVPIAESKVGDCDAYWTHDYQEPVTHVIRIWQEHCLGWDFVTSPSTEIGGIACARAARPPSEVVKAARTWGDVCFPKTAATTAENSVIDTFAKTQHCVSLVQQGATSMKLLSNGCTYAESETFDWYAVEAEKRRYQQDYDERTRACVDLALNGASSTELFFQGCDGSFFGSTNYDYFAVEQAKRDYQRYYDENTDFCVDLAENGANSTTMWLNNCDGSFGSDRHFDQFEVDQAEREFKRDFDYQTDVCVELAGQGADRWEMAANGCDYPQYGNPTFDQNAVEDAEREYDWWYQRECESTGSSSSVFVDPWDEDCQ